MATRKASVQSANQANVNPTIQSMIDQGLVEINQSVQAKLQSLSDIVVRSTSVKQTLMDRINECMEELDSLTSEYSNLLSGIDQTEVDYIHKRYDLQVDILEDEKNLENETQALTMDINVSSKKGGDLEHLSNEALRSAHIHKVKGELGLINQEHNIRVRKQWLKMLDDGYGNTLAIRYEQYRPQANLAALKSEARLLKIRIDNTQAKLNALIAMLQNC